ncbi:MAG TPA: hypothetical protein VM536_19900 [Chloroflexia bacterium]|nr:hypothetical protein [Chloroflexia bacterium]
MLDPREQLASVATGRLPEIVRLALGAPDAALGQWSAVPLQGGIGASDPTRALFLLQGMADTGAAQRSWSLVLRLRAPVADRDDPAHIGYWQREALLYSSGLLAGLPAGLSVPRCYGCDTAADGVVRLWLEHVQEDGAASWPLTRWALAARHLGRFNGAYLSGRPLPRAPWLGWRLRTWVAQHEPLVARIAAAPRNPDVRQWWPQPVVDAILRLWAERDVFCTALEALPPTFGHGDAIRRNLLARRGAEGEDETVAIDWEFAGYYAAGEEVGQTLSVAAAFFDVEPFTLPALDEALFTSYLAGLRDMGWQGDSRAVRFAYAAHAALRNAFNAVGTTVPDSARRLATQQNYGHTWEELAGRRAALRPFLLERADEARRLLGSL